MPFIEDSPSITKVDLELFDGANYVERTFFVKALKPPNLPTTIGNMVKGLKNSGAPTFDIAPVSYIKIEVGTPFTYQLSSISDPDKDPVQVNVDFMRTKNFCSF